MALGVYLVLMTAVVSGFSIFLNSYAVKGFDSSVFTFSKNLVVALLLTAVILGMSQWKTLLRITKKQWEQLALIGFIGGSVPFLLFFKGLQLSTASTASFIHKLLFVFVAVFALFMLREKMTKPLLAGAAFLMVGTYVMIKPQFEMNVGTALILGATVLWAIEQTYAKKVLKELSGTVVAWGRMFFGAVFMMPFLLFTGKLSLVTSMTQSQWLWILLTSALLFLYVFTFYNGLKEVKVTTAACILSLGAPITALLSWIVQGKTILIGDAVGMLLILTGVLTVILFSQLQVNVAGAAHGRD